jgi:hypothetical protein
MVRQVGLREQRLKQEVADLRIEIDEVKKARQVARSPRRNTSNSCGLKPSTFGKPGLAKASDQGFP